MRFMLEDITRAIYLDIDLGESKVDAKLNRLSELQNKWGFKTFREKINPTGFLNEKMESL